MNRLPHSSSAHGYQILKQSSDDLPSDTQRYYRQQPRRYATIDTPPVRYVSEASDGAAYYRLYDHPSNNGASCSSKSSPNQWAQQRQARLLPQPLLHEGGTVVRRLSQMAHSFDTAVLQARNDIRQSSTQTRQRRMLPNGFPKGETIDGYAVANWDPLVFFYF